MNDPLETEVAELHADHNNNNVNQEKLETPQGPRLPPEVQSHGIDSGGKIALALVENNMKKSPSEAPPNQNEAFSSPKKESEKMGNGVREYVFLALTNLKITNSNFTHMLRVSCSTLFLVLCFDPLL